MLTSLCLVKNGSWVAMNSASLLLGWRKFSVSVTGRAGAAVTALYDFHVKNGGKMVNFGGFMLPVQYGEHGIAASHQHTRTAASLFDVSHMLQTEVEGAESLNYMESLCTADVQNLEIGAGTLTLFTDARTAGILDDLIITKLADDHLYVVSNAARADHDRQLMAARLEAVGGGMRVRHFGPGDRSLLALQGPRAAECLQRLTDVNLSALWFMRSTVATVAGVDTCRVTRCGYTGEDGFEISIPAMKSADVAEALLSDVGLPGVCRLAGLGARDTLRLEAGLCLYGSDMDEHTTPSEAGLAWLVQKRRRELEDYPGAAMVRQIMEKGGPRKRRVGLIALKMGPPARNGTSIHVSGDHREAPIGTVTSGCPSPTLGKNIAMAYVPVEYSKPGTTLFYRIRDKLYGTQVTKLPFVQTHYYVKNNRQ